MEGYEKNHIEIFVDKYDWQNIYMTLDEKYVFKFDSIRLLGTDHARNKFIQLSKMLSYYFLWFLCEDDTEKQIQIAQDLRKQYCELCSTLKRDRKIIHIDILLLLVTLSSQECIKKYLIKTYEHNQEINAYSPEKQKQNQKTKLQSYLYIILVQQTIGNLVSPFAINYLKSRYIKESLFCPEDIRQNYRVQKSLKHVQENILNNSKKTFFAERKKNLKSQIRIILNNNLRVKHEYRKVVGNNIYESENIFQHLFSKNVINKKKSISQDSLKTKSFSGISKAVEINYHLKNKDRDIKFHKITDKVSKYTRAISIKSRSQSQNNRERILVLQKRHDLSRSYSIDKWMETVKRIKKCNSDIPTQSFQQIHKSITNKTLKQIENNRRSSMNINFQKQAVKVIVMSEIKQYSNLPIINKQKPLTKFIKANLWTDGKLRRKAKVNREGRYFGIAQK